MSSFNFAKMSTDAKETQKDQPSKEAKPDEVEVEDDDEEDDTDDEMPVRHISSRFLRC